MGGGTFNGKRIAGTTAPAGAQRSAVSMNGNTSIRQPGVTAGQSSVPTANPAGRLATANRLLDNPVQSSRTGTEANLNPQVGEALRRSLIEQQRLSGPTYGSMGAFERRDRRDARTANQASVDSGLAALQGIREGSVTERGQNMAATATLEDRQMQEAGAFDRTLLGLDQTMLEGQFGLADRAAQSAAADPYAGFTLDVMGQIAKDADTNTLMGLANLGRGQGAMVAPTNPFSMESGPTGTVITGPSSKEAFVMQEYQRLGPNTPAGQAFLTGQGYAMDENGRMRTLEAADAADAGARQSQEALKAAIDWNAQQAAFAAQQAQQRRKERLPWQQTSSAPFGDMMSITPGGVR
jgi:hypothetical protein